ncbi:unnamed protein product [Rodentolepis nana]|uniref:FHA domain-containing protein n=1 Tax=Rodentolepis nana TaxID=102285 RepID=A0A0R3T3Q9_RODNA|nr:unnamed protein product [Rodentolepis nana]
MSQLDLIRIENSINKGPLSKNCPRKIIIQEIHDKISIGRMNLNDPPHIPIESHDSIDIIAEKHAEIRKIFGQNFVVYDLSTTGTYVNSKRVKKYAVLKSKDILAFGKPLTPSTTSGIPTNSPLPCPVFEVKIGSSLQKKDQNIGFHSGSLDELPWLDDRMCDLLFDKTSEVISENIAITNLYQQSRSKLEAISKWKESWINIYLFIPDGIGPAKRVNALGSSLNDLLEVLDKRPHVPVIQYHYFNASDLSENKADTMFTLKNIIMPLFQNFEPRESVLDCMVFFVDLEASFEHAIKYIIDFVNYEQALLIVLIHDVRSAFKTKTECILEFLRRLGGYYKSGFIWTHGKWRIWCVDRGCDESIDLRDMPLWSPERTSPEMF